MAWIEDARDHALRKIDRTLASTPGRFPHYTEGGRWVTTEDGAWTGGLWVGQLWLAYRWTGRRRYRDAARGLMEALEARIDRTDADVDLGFLLVPSLVRGHRLSPRDGLGAGALRGADRMLGFLHERAGLIHTVYAARSARHGRDVGSAIVDILPNLALLWWAGTEAGDPRYHRAARRHALRTQDLLVRPDGSTFQVVDFDLDSGATLHRGTVHGHDDASTWARGQAWAVHGFALAARASGDAALAGAAGRVSSFFAERVPPDALPHWDLCDPEIPRAPRDASAAAIASAGWLRMPGGWPSRGRRALEALAGGSLTDEGADGILARATAYRTQGRGVEQATVWGDYFFVLGLAQLDGSEPDPAL